MRREIIIYPAILAMLLTTTLMGCRQEPLPAAGDAIRFSVSSVDISPAPTKTDPPIPDPATIERPANVLTVSGSHVAVWASLNAGSGWNYVFGNDPFIEIVKEGDNWNYSGDKYWNRDASYKFRALRPTDADVQANSSVDELKIDYTDNTQDLMVAYTTLAGAGAKTVDLAFSHVCSAVRIFIVDPDRGTQAARYKITSLQLQNLYMAGTLTCNSAGNVWAPQGERTTGFAWPATPGADWDVPATYTAFTNWLFFIPQALQQTDGKHPAITISFTAGSQSLDATLPIETNGTDGVIWEPGKLYTYYIMIRPKAITVQVEWTDWESGVEHDYGQVG